MGTEFRWSGLSRKFRDVHGGAINDWLSAFMRGGPPYYRVVPREMLRAVSLDAVIGPQEAVTIVTLRAEKERLWVAGSPIGYVVTVSPTDDSRPAVAEWEDKHRDKSVADILWFPSFGSVEKVA